MGFKDWIHQYYGMPVGKLIDSEMVKNISFNDLANAYNAGSISHTDSKLHSYLIIMDENLFFRDELSPEIMECAINQKAFVVDCTSRLYFSPPDGWVELTEGSNGTKEKTKEG